MSAPPPTSPNVKVALDWLDGFNGVIDIEKILNPLSDQGYEHHILPRSLARPIRTKQEFADYFMNEVCSMFVSFKAFVESVVEDSAAGVVVIHASSKAKTITGSDYANEYILTFYVVEEDGNRKIRKIEEFVDSLFSSAFFKAEREKISQMKVAAV